MAEKAEGNPLFAEEIVSYLIERGAIRATVDFDLNALAAALPGSVQSLLTARVDRLAPNDRTLLQAASVIGRQFDPDLLAVAVGQPDVEARLSALHALGLVGSVEKSGDYLFKHALVRDALYHSLLGDGRTALHAKIADELERRGGNRLIEVAEVLAYHYSQTSRADKAFGYLSMAGSKSLGVYSLDEAATHFAAALVLLDKGPECASNDQVAEFLVSYALLLNLTDQVKTMIGILERYLPRIDRLGDDVRAVLIRHHYVFALVWNTRYREAAAVQRETLPIAERLGDSRSRAYSLTSELLVSTTAAPKALRSLRYSKEKQSRSRLTPMIVTFRVGRGVSLGGRSFTEG